MGKKRHREEVSPSDASGKKRPRGDTSPSGVAGKKRHLEEAGSSRGEGQRLWWEREVEKIRKKKNHLKSQLKEALHQILQLEKKRKRLQKQRNRAQDNNLKHDLYRDYGEYAMQFQYFAAKTIRVPWYLLKDHLEEERDRYGAKKWKQTAHTNLLTFLKANGFKKKDWDALERFVDKRNMICHSDPPEDEAARKKLKDNLAKFEKFLGAGEEEVLRKIITLDEEQHFFLRRDDSEESSESE